MPCCRCSTQRAKPHVGSARASRWCASGSDHRAPRSASPRWPPTWRGDGAPRGAGALARGHVALPGAGVGARDHGALERTSGDLRTVAQSHLAVAVSSPGRRDGPAHQPPPRRRVPRRVVRALGVPRGAGIVQARRRRGAAGPRAPPAPGRRGGAHPRRPAGSGGTDEAGRPGRGPARKRAGDRGRRAGVLRLVDPLVGPILPAAAVRGGGHRVQPAVRGRAGQGRVAAGPLAGGAGAAGRDLRPGRGTRDEGRVSPARVVRWLWGTSPTARVARLSLVPLAGVYWAAMWVRNARHAGGGVVRLPLPTIAVGNLSVGGTGKTPLAAWIAAYCARRGWKPGILLRGYGGDEPLVHRRLVPDAIVVANPDRVAGAAAARAGGARVLVLDDAYQLLGVARDLNLAVVSAESWLGSSWPLPAGPWRERWEALQRADVIVVTRKHAPARAAVDVAGRLARRRPGTPIAIAWLALEHLEGIQSGTRSELGTLAGREVVAAAGIADPASFAAQLSAAGARVQLLAFQDHHAY